MVTMTTTTTGTAEELRYARGFILGRERRTSAPSHWATIQVGNWVFKHDPKVNSARRDCVDGSSVILYGHAVDLETGESDIGAIANTLVSAPLRFVQDIIDRLSGRFVVIFHYADELHIQQDATGMRVVYYTEPQYEFVAGSHQDLVASQVNATPNAFAGAYLVNNNMQVLPGRVTARQGVVRMTPNTELSSTTRQLSRIFPRKPLRPCSVEEAASAVIQAAEVQLAAYPSDMPLLASLTAGLDSRVTMALLRGAKDRTEFFTYELTYQERNAGNEHDRTAANELAKRFDLKHRNFDIMSPDIDAELRTVMEANSVLSHSRAIAHAYRQSLPPAGLHIRSNVFEIGRCYYRQMGLAPEHMSAKSMRYIISNTKSLDQAAVDAFEEYRNMTDFDSTRDFGYEAADMFYWEHRMGVWMAPVLHESDIANDTHVLINSRRVLEALLGVDIDLRQSGEVFKRIIAQQWPEIAEVPVNGQLLSIS